MGDSIERPRMGVMDCVRERWEDGRVLGFSRTRMVLVCICHWLAVSGQLPSLTEAQTKIMIDRDKTKFERRLATMGGRG